MFTLHDINERAYCGPSVLMALTGLPLAEVRTAINKAKGRRHNAGIIGTSNAELVDALDTLGYASEWLHPVKHSVGNSNMTLRYFVENKCQKGCFYIVNVTGHYVAVLDGNVADNFIRFGCPVAEHPSRRKYVQRVLWVRGTHEWLADQYYLSQGCEL